MSVNLFYRNLRKGGKVGRIVHDEEVTPGFSCKHGKGFRLQFTDDVFALGILPHAVFSLRVGYGGAFRGADTYCDDEQVFLARFIQQGRGEIHGVFAITQDDQRVCSGS